MSNTRPPNFLGQRMSDAYAPTFLRDPPSPSSTRRMGCLARCVTHHQRPPVTHRARAVVHPRLLSSRIFGRPVVKFTLRQQRADTEWVRDNHRQ